MFARRGNRQYTITAADATGYQKQGYDIIDDDGNVLKYGAGKMVAYEKYANLEKELKVAQQKIKELEAQVKNEEPAAPQKKGGK